MSELIRTVVANMKNPSVASVYRSKGLDSFGSDLSIILNGNKYEYRKVRWAKKDNKVRMVLGNSPAQVRILEDNGWELFPMRYGYNGNQSAAMYIRKNPLPFGQINLFRFGKGGPSLTNLEDMAHALHTLKYANTSMAVVMKHLLPASAAQMYKNVSSKKIEDLANEVLHIDKRSNFGGIWGFNFPVNTKVAEIIIDQFCEGVIAPDYSSGALNTLSARKDLRIAKTKNIYNIPKFKGDNTYGIVDFRTAADGSIFIQEPYLSSIRTADDLTIQPILQDSEGRTITRGKIKPSKQVLEEALFSWRLNFNYRSNCVLATKGHRLLSVGTGETERVGATEQMILKARDKQRVFLSNYLITQGFIKPEDLLIDTLYQEGVNSLEGGFYPYSISESIFDEIIENSHGNLEGSVISSDAFIPNRDNIELIADLGIEAIVLPPGSLMDYDVVNSCNDNNIAVIYVPPEDRCFMHF